MAPIKREVEADRDLTVFVVVGELTADREFVEQARQASKPSNPFEP